MSGFLQRWSRLKNAAQQADRLAGSLDTLDAEALLANLGPDSDFGVFLREEVSEAIRRQALKTLFADPHFNTMDGLDVYIDDYSIADPIPPEMLASLKQARSLLFDEPEAAMPPDSPTEPSDEAAAALAELPAERPTDQPPARGDA